MTRDEHLDRISKLQQRIGDGDLDGALIHGVSNLYYFTGTAQQAHLWVPAQGDAILLVRRVVERARAESKLDAIEAMPSLKKLPGFLGGARRIGMELDIMPVAMFGRYQRAIADLDATDIGGATRQVRAVKSPHEIEAIRAAARASDAAFADACGAVRTGMSELELSILIESAERRHGFQGMLRWRAAAGFECPWVHVLAGDSALQFSFADTPFGGAGVTPAAPYGASHAKIEARQPVCVDFALARDGYIHDMTRTLSIGELPARLVEAYQVCRGINDMIREQARPGVTGEDLWNRAVVMAESAGLAEHFMGYGDQRVRFVGHGVGLELDELPVLAPRQSMELEAGNVIAVEPKFFFPGVGAVGLENTYAIHADHVETLTTTPEELLVLE